MADEIKRIELGKVTRPSKQVLNVERDVLDDFVAFISSKLPFGSFVLKGGYVFGELTGAPRYTADVDISLPESTPYDAVKALLHEYAEQLVKDGKCSSYNVRDEIVPGRKSGGAEFYFGEGGDLLFSCDISYPDGKTFATTVINSDRFGKLEITSLEQLMSDKLTVLFSRKRFRRIKDLYDLYTISQMSEELQPDLEVVAGCLDNRSNWPLPLDMYPFTEERIEALKHAWEKFYLQDASGNVKVKPDIYDMIEAVSRLIDPLIQDGVIE